MENEQGSDRPAGSGAAADDAVSRATLRALFEAALDGMMVVDDEACVIDVNAAAARLCGEPPGALIGRPVADFTPAPLRDRARERWRAFLRDGTRLDTTTLARADGSQVEVEYAGTANFMPGRHLWVLRDVTARNHAQRQVQFQAELLDHVEAAVVAVDLAARVTHWNAAAERLYGVSRADATGRLVRELVVAEGEEGTADEVIARVREGGVWEGEFTVRRSDGERVQAWVLNAPIPASDGGVAGYVGVAVDITERRRAARQLERSRATKQTILDSVFDPVVAMDGEGRTIVWNPAAEATFGYTREEMIGRPLLEAIWPPSVLAAFHEEQIRYREEGRAWPLNERVELTATRADGTEFPVELSVTDARLDDGSPIFTAYIRDISERKAAEALLARRADQQAAVAALGQRALTGGALDGLMHDAVATVARTLAVERVALLERTRDGRGMIVRATTGGAGEAAVGDRLRDDVPSPHHDVAVGGATAEEPWGVLRARASDTDGLDEDDVNFLRAVANVMGNAIERRRSEDATRHRSLHDDLTGLPNRTLFLDRLEHALAQTDRRGLTVAVVFLDLDQFKLVNDSLGHEHGDRLLQAVVPRLRKALRPGDTLARFAGDEFLILCEDIEDERGASVVAERLLECFAPPFELGDRDQYVSASMGIALPRRPGQSAEDLIRDADAAMYRAKERGRARYELFDERMRLRALMRMRIENDLRRAVPGEALQVHYQPIVSMAGKGVAGFEALARWHHPRRGDVPPAEFIPIAEESGLIGSIGRWVLEQAAEQGVRWCGLAGSRTEPLTVSVNLSARQFAQGHLPDDVAAVLATTGLPPQRLLLEITESVLMEETGPALEALRALKGLGVGLVLDDFGTGYSSLSYLERFPIDAIKIDRSFVAGLVSGGSAPIVGAIVSMAHSLGMRVTAEGVETREQIEHLRRLGCEYVQGFLLGRPAAPATHDRLLVAPSPVVAERP